MNADDYIEQRLESARVWYSRNSQWCKNWHNSLQLLQIFCAASIPFLPSLLKELDLLNIVTGGFGVFIALVAGVSALYKFEEKWTKYRTASESLKHEKFLFLTQAGPYTETDSFPLLVRRVETLISQENREWAENSGNTGN